MDLGLIPLEHSKLDINMESMWDVYGIDLGFFVGLIPYPCFHIPCPISIISTNSKSPIQYF